MSQISTTHRGRAVLSVVAALALTAAPSANAGAQNPLRSWADAIESRYSARQPVLDYAIHVDPGDTTGFDVTMHVANAPDTFHVAMAAHPEYDDRYSRYVTGLHADSPRGGASVARADSAMWRVVAPGGDVTLRYRISLPPPTGIRRLAYRPFVSSTGALVGDLHSCMYVVGQELAPAHVAVNVPLGWDVATGLEPTFDPHTFYAPSALVLTESPILVGRLRNWHFTIDGVPHRVAYLAAPDASPFDTAAFVRDIESVVRQTAALFGRLPYRDYNFLLQDGAFGSLEHANSVTIGIPSSDLAADPRAYVDAIAHEYFHAFNGMRIHTAEFGEVRDSTPPRSAGLWWTEGATMFYADLLARRAGIPLRDSTRIAHLARLIGAYFSGSGNTLLSAERVSRAAYGAQEMQLGDNTASTHLQGELITTLLDLVILDSTRDHRSIDDVTRAMLRDYSGSAGFVGDDVAREVNRACACDVRPFFAAHVHGHVPLDFNRYLQLIGLTVSVGRVPALNSDGSQQADLRFSAWQPSDGGEVRAYVLDTTSVWEHAGLHTGDRIVSIKGTPTPDVASVRAAVRALKIGDSLTVVVRRPGGPFRASLIVTGYERAVATITARSDATAAQVARREAWLTGASNSAVRQ